MTNLSKKLIIIVTSLQLLGCGFQLQNSANFVGKLETLYIQTTDSYTVFYQTMKRQMVDNGVEITTERAAADFVLTIHADESDQRILSVSGRNTPREYEVYYLVKWSLTKGNQIIIQPTTNIDSRITLLINDNYWENLPKVVSFRNHWRRILFR